MCSPQKANRVEVCCGWVASLEINIHSDFVYFRNPNVKGPPMGCYSEGRVTQLAKSTSVDCIRYPKVLLQRTLNQND